MTVLDMAEQFHFEITTPEGKQFSDDVAHVSLPTVDGEITVLAHHEPLVSLLVPGELRIAQNGETTVYAIAGGFLEVRDNTATVLADSAVRAEEIDEARAEAARQKAEELMRDQRLNDEVYAEAAAALERNLARLKVARKYRHRGHRGVTQEGVLHE